MGSINNLKKFLRSIDGQSRVNLSMCFDEKYEYYNGVGITLLRYDCIRYETLKMVISVPSSLLRADVSAEDALFAEDYLYRHFSPRLCMLSREYENDRKDKRLQCELFLCPYNSRINRRNASFYDAEKREWSMTVLARIPCVGIHSINGKLFSRFIGDIVRAVSDAADNIDAEDYRAGTNIYKRQKSIRKYMQEHDAVCFIANGSILPRIGTGDDPNMQAVKFESPKSLTATIELDDGTSVTGMLLKRGITVIVGGAYSGKSTLLDAIEEGVYDHIAGDGRELVITDRSAVKVNAEDGRPVSRLDLSPFFKNIPPSGDAVDFSTEHASGSVSQAANIVEAVYGGSKLLLIDEDSSATNFLVRDQSIRRIIKTDPITPFTDRIKELSDMGTSTVFVCGALSDYLPLADTVILAERFVAKDIDDISVDAPTHDALPKASWTEKRTLWLDRPEHPEVDFSSSAVDGGSIVVGGYKSDIARLSALTSTPQINALRRSLLCYLTDTDNYMLELSDAAKNVCERLFCEDSTQSSAPSPDEYWIEDIRPIDICCAVNRLSAQHGGEDENQDQISENEGVMPI